MWLNSGHILKVQLTPFADTLDSGWGRKGEIKKDTKIFDLSNWKSGIAINRDGEDFRKSRFPMEVQVWA